MKQNIDYFFGCCKSKRRRTRSTIRPVDTSRWLLWLEWFYQIATRRRQSWRARRRHREHSTDWIHAHNQRIRSTIDCWVDWMLRSVCFAWLACDSSVSLGLGFRWAWRSPPADTCASARSRPPVEPRRKPRACGINDRARTRIGCDNRSRPNTCWTLHSWDSSSRESVLPLIIF